MPANIQTFLYQNVANDYIANGATFVQQYGNQITGLGGVTFNNTNNQQTCAIRVSMALHQGGVRLPRVINSWLYTTDDVYLPSLAGDYHDGLILMGGEAVANAAAIANRRGVIYFGGNFQSASGHITLWNNNATADNTPAAYWNQPNIRFWPML
jgi:hypothetical protein